MILRCGSKKISSVPTSIPFRFWKGIEPCKKRDLLYTINLTWVEMVNIQGIRQRFFVCFGYEPNQYLQAKALYTFGFIL